MSLTENSIKEFSKRTGFKDNDCIFAEGVGGKSVYIKFPSLQGKMKDDREYLYSYKGTKCVKDGEQRDIKIKAVLDTVVENKGWMTHWLQGNDGIREFITTNQDKKMRKRKRENGRVGFKKDIDIVKAFLDNQTSRESSSNITLRLKFKNAKYLKKFKTNLSQIMDC